MRKIKVFAQGNAWMVDFVGNNTIKELFGTTCIPSAFTVKTPIATVLASIQNHNPECVVSFGR